MKISIRYNPHLDQTRVMIQRTVMQPWSPDLADEEAQPVQASAPRVNSSEVKRRAGAQRKKSRRQTKPRRWLADAE